MPGVAGCVVGTGGTSSVSVVPIAAAPLRVDLDRVAAELRSAAAEASLDLALKVADILIQNVYGGDAEVWRRRKKQGQAPLREIARRDDVPFSASTLYRALAVREMVARMGGRAECGDLSLSHFYQVLKLPAGRQVELLGEALSEGLGPRALGERSTGRKAGVRTTLRRIEWLSKELSTGALAMRNLSDGLSPAAADELAALLPKLIRRLERLQRVVQDEGPG